MRKLYAALILIALTGFMWLCVLVVMQGLTQLSAPQKLRTAAYFIRIKDAQNGQCWRLGLAIDGSFVKGESVHDSFCTAVK